MKKNVVATSVIVLAIKLSVFVSEVLAHYSLRSDNNESLATDNFSSTLPTVTDLASARQLGVV
jgi:hypothetical protein